MFAGSIQSAGNPDDGGANGFKVSNGKITATRDSTADLFLGYTRGNSTPTSTIAADGSATFALNGVFAGGCRAGAIGANSPTIGAVGSIIGETGKIAATATGDNVWEGRLSGNTATTSRITAGGSAVFSGNVTANGTILTRASGNLDVGERLEKADNALQALKTAVATATDFTTLKAAIISSLQEV